DMPTIQAMAGNANIMIRTVIPEHPCSACGQENRSTSRFCRHCGQSLEDSSALVEGVCQVGYVSDVGRRYVAQENEDMLLVVQGLGINLVPPPRPFSLLAVADGLRGPLGRSAGGHEASHLAVETVADVLIPQLTTPSHSTSSHTQLTSTSVKLASARNAKPLPTIDTVLEQWLRESVRQANSVIYHCNADYDTSMASTLTIAMIYKYRFYSASVGDSRAYYYNQNKGIRRVTTDQTNNIRLGQSAHTPIDLFQCDVTVNGLVLLCTDGLWKMLSDERLEELLAQGYSDDPQRLARTLVDAANLAGGEGNISAIVLRLK
ncbi:MAG: PP2C family serine/threonine-protein phosphatase, partial [Ktedonobacteraceae bacterium]